MTPRTKSEAMASIRVPEVGEGNVTAALSVQLLLEKAGVTTTLSGPRWAAMIARLFHSSISSSPTASREYTRSSERTRHLGLWVFALITSLEHTIHRTNRLTEDASPHALIFTQEHGMMGDYRLIRQNGKAFLLVPDVEPKRSAITALKKIGSGVTAIVWNQQALTALRNEGIPAVQVDPFILQGFEKLQDPADRQLFEATDRVILKTSGSGIPSLWLSNLTEALQRLGRDFAGYTPSAVISPQAEQSRPPDSRQKILEFNADLIAHPPQVIICYPSEMIQVAAALWRQGIRVRLLCLPPRGEHELKNLRWAQQYLGALALSRWDLEDPEYLCKIIKEKCANEVGNASLMDIALDVEVNGFSLCDFLLSELEVTQSSVSELPID